MVLHSWLRRRSSSSSSTHQQRIVAALHPAVRRAARVAVESLEDRRLFSTTFDLQHTLRSPAQEDWAFFGQGLDASGDLVAVGGPGANGSQGEAHVFNASTGQLVASLQNPDQDGVAADGFGEAVAFAGPGGSNVLVGAKGEETDLSLAVGAAYLYDANTGNLLTTFVNPDPDPNDFFGSVVAAYGDDQVLIGSTGDGAIYQFDLDGNLVRTYTDPAGGLLGGGIAVKGDFVALAGSGVDGSGSVLLFNGVTGNLIHTFENPSDSVGSFGFDVEFGNDDSIFISDAANSDDAFFSGRVFRYSLISFNQIGFYANPTPDFGFEQFGSSIEVRGNQLVVGVAGEIRDMEVTDPETNETFTEPTQVGAVYVLDIDTGAVESIIDNPTPVHPINTPDFGNDTFGARVALAGDRIIVADPTDESETNNNAGGVYVYEEEGITPVNQPPVANAGADASANENGSVTLDASGSTDPDGLGDIVSYAWDLDNDGQYDDATGLTVNFGQDLPGSYTVGLLVTDSVGNTSTDSVVVTFNDLQPTANAGGDETVQQGDAVNFSGTASNPSGDAIVSYEWDFDYDGSSFDIDASGANASTVYTAAGVRTVALRVTDDDGDVTVTTINVTVEAPPPANTPPVVNPAAGPSSAVRNQELTFTGSFSDPDEGDTHEVEWDFGDGTVIAFHSTSDAGALSPTHAYAATGSYDVVYRIRDAEGAVVSSGVHTVNVTASTMVGGTLFIGTNNGGDLVTIVANGGGVRYQVGAGGAIEVANPTKIVIYGGDSSDIINVSSSVLVPLEIYGGDGVDLIKGGRANDIIVGGAGSDLIAGAQGRDILIGGLDSDIIVGNQDDDILIAGNTAYDANSTALNAILAEWSSSRTYTERVNNLRNGTGSATRLNGSFFLDSDVTVFDDGEMDLLTGNQGTDWFLFNADNGGRDLVIDRTSAELADDLDFIDTDPTL